MQNKVTLGEIETDLLKIECEAELETDVGENNITTIFITDSSLNKETGRVRVESICISDYKMEALIKAYRAHKRAVKRKLGA